MDHEGRKRLLKLSAKDIAWQQSETTVLQPLSSQDHQMNIREEPERKAPGDRGLLKAYCCLHRKAQHYAVGRGAEPAGL